MSALTFSEQGDQAVLEYKEIIERQLEIVRPYFDTILKPIRRVELEQRRLESPLDQTLQFKTNTPEILRILIEGVYDREDVFIRELVQNSLDSCLVRRAKQQKRNASYNPQILLTVYYDYEQDKPRAFRIDDNGIGMDLTDVQDTVVWIGNTISSKPDIVTLLQQTLGKNLIATFGIGLLSCFKSSGSITIRSHKENETPLQFELTSVTDNIKLEKSSDDTIGTTAIVKLSENKIEEFKSEEAIAYYFRKVEQVELKELWLEWDPDLLELSRDDISKIALTEGWNIEPKDYYQPYEHVVEFELYGDDFSGFIWLPKSDMQSVVNFEGSVDILNEGIFVTNEPIIDWLPEHMSFCEAVFNFSSNSISLPAGRDRVIKDEKFRAKKRFIMDKSFGFIDKLVNQTHRKEIEERDFAALVLTYMYSNAEASLRERILKRLDDYKARRYKREERLSLKQLLDYEKVYIQYTQGRVVSELTDLDGKKLYHKEDDFVELQAAMLAQEDSIVISATRHDAEQAILEAALIKAYLASFNNEIIDLTTTNILEGKQRSKPVPNIVRQEVGPVIKFVEVTGLPSKKAWKVGNEVWINLANPSMKGVYKELQQIQYEPDNVIFASVLFKILSYQFDSAIHDLIGIIRQNNTL
ncbi:MAG: hypothetical protein AUG51_05140 [Acidobacteria bacterium 13_1_20CM_3_53_8]|nr:MAG: hypothetical protein AUG51_05140 [Acidobacteria bacterium 13_1_20CM_3_53_8]